MPKSDHEFKRSFVEGDPAQCEEKNLAEAEEKLASFAWEDDEEENEEAVPFTVNIDDLDMCVSKLADYLLEHLSSDQFQGMDTEGMHFTLPIDLDLDPLLHERFSDNWTLESRLMFFQCIRDQLILEFIDTKQRAKLDKKIGEALPPTHRKKFTSGTVEIYDDALMVNDESNTVTIEVPIHFVANA